MNYNDTEQDEEYNKYKLKILTMGDNTIEEIDLTKTKIMQKH